jgi:hypothetical protein
MAAIFPNFFQKMTSEAEAEKRFLEDLERAKALSMESQAFEQFRFNFALLGRKNLTGYRVNKIKAQFGEHGASPKRRELKSTVFYRV